MAAVPEPSKKKANKAKSSEAKSSEEILAGFQRLRGEQRILTSKLAEMEMEQHEHKLVVETLEHMDGDRKCFRMVGGVLCERTVKEVLPILRNNEEQLRKLVETLKQQLVAKGSEINSYKDKHNVKIKGIDVADVADSESKVSGGGAGGVLVS